MKTGTQISVEFVRWYSHNFKNQATYILSKTKQSHSQTNSEKKKKIKNRSGQAARVPASSKCPQSAHEAHQLLHKVYGSDGLRGRFLRHSSVSVVEWFWIWKCLVVRSVFVSLEEMASVPAGLSELWEDFWNKASSTFFNIGPTWVGTIGVVWWLGMQAPFSALSESGRDKTTEGKTLRGLF